MKSNIGINNKKRENSDINKNYEDSPLKINAENFNDYFLKVAENILEKIKSDNNLKTNNTTYSPYKLLQIYNLKYDSIRFNDTSTGEIEKIIKSLPWKSSRG
jgi:hypothetical protein